MESTVVVGYDHTPSSERALLEAGREASWRHARLVVVNAFQWLTAVPPMAYPPTEAEHSVRKAATETAEHGAGLIRERYPGMTVTALAQDGPAAKTLADAARRAEVLVVGNRGRGGFAGLLLGSVSMRTLDASSTPTMVVRGSPHAPRDLVVAAVDIAAPGGEPLEFAFAEASRRQARLEVVHAWDRQWFSADADGAPEVEAAIKQTTADLDSDLEKAIRPWQARHPDVRTVRRIVDGPAGALLNEASQRADLVVVGAHRRLDDHQGMRVGPVAHQVLHHADCPVVVVPRG